MPRDIIIINMSNGLSYKDFLDIAISINNNVMREKKGTKTLKEQWADICNVYLEMFCARHGYQYEPKYVWVADEPGTVACIGDLYVGMEDIRYDVDHDIPIDYFEKWYWKNLEVYELTKCNYMNYSSYCKGAPDDWSEERLQRAREAHRRLEEAQLTFEKEMKEIKEMGDF